MHLGVVAIEKRAIWSPSTTVDQLSFYIYIYIYIYIYVCVCVCVCGAFSKFHDFFVLAFKIVADSWKTSMLLLYILYDNGPFSMISVSKEQLPQELEYNILKPYCHSWWISTMQSGRTICNKSLF